MADFPSTWVLVADAARARIFGWSGPAEPLLELRDLVNPEGRHKDRSLTSDRPGLAFDSGGHSSGHPMQAAHSASDAAAQAFARQVARELEDGLEDGGYQKLVLFAPAHFLGLLRDDLSARVAKTVVESSALEITQESPEEIKARLPRLSSLT